ncbi:Stf0 sulfotransferase [Rosistilla carotiformis]|uniref:Stf0 sulfotransferase n=1 Tax=Rosistilla carotiformis TaxID=2528017 RepID=A0A518JVF6_9BACT|nr:Stf0 sulfotransferase [Rosistilla carotiformis]
MLLNLLSSHPRVKHCGERFTDNRMKREDFSDRDLLSEFKQDLQRKGFEKAIGAKFLYYQLEADYADRFNAPGLRDVQQYLLQNRRMRIVHLTRRNVLRTVISMIVAAKTGVYRAHDKTQLPSDATVDVSPADCLARLQLVRNFEAKTRQQFCHHPMLEMVYEELVANQDQATDRLLRFLNVDPMPLSGRMVRQSKSLRDSVSNFDELAAALAGTEWESMLTDDVV